MSAAENILTNKMNAVVPGKKDFRRERHKLSAKIAAEKMQGIRHEDSTAAVTDPVITPFLNAMKSVGCNPVANRSGTLLINRCMNCHTTSVYTLDGPKGKFQMCAKCHILP